MTSVEVWAPAFAKVLKEPLSAAAIFSTAEDRHFPSQRWCNLCETHVGVGTELDRHARQHQRELDAWRKGGRREAEKAATARLRELNREKALEKKVLGRAPGGGDVADPPSSGRHEPTTTKEEGTMSSTDEKVDPAALYSALTDRVKETIEGAKVESKKNKAHSYAAITVDGKNVGYVSQGKRGVSVQIRKGKDAGTRSVKSPGDVGTAVTALARVAETVQASAKPAEAAKPAAAAAPKKGTAKAAKKGTTRGAKEPAAA